MTDFPPQSSDENPIELMLTMSQVMVGLTARAIAESQEPVTLVQLRAMIAISQTEDAQSTSTLARELGVSPSTAMRMCQRLVDRGLATRAVNPKNRQESICSLTPKGRRVVYALLEQRAKAFAEIAAQIPDDDRHSLLVGIKAFIKASGVKRLNPPSL